MLEANFIMFCVPHNLRIDEKQITYEASSTNNEMTPHIY